MTELLAGIGSAIWLGILTSISPCPLASNVAAVSYLGRQAAKPRRVLLAGLAYSAGRALTYVFVGWLVVASILSVPGVSYFLQQRMNQVLGPLLVLIGVGIIGWLPVRLPATGFGDEWRERVAARGILGAAALGILFALSFCPVSAGLFFGGLIPLAAARGVAVAFHALSRFEPVARVVTAVIFIGAGAYLILTHWFGVEF